QQGGADAAASVRGIDGPADQPRRALHGAQMDVAAQLLALHRGEHRGRGGRRGLEQRAHPARPDHGRGRAGGEGAEDPRLLAAVDLPQVQAPHAALTVRAGEAERISSYEAPSSMPSRKAEEPQSRSMNGGRPSACSRHSGRSGCTAATVLMIAWPTRSGSRTSGPAPARAGSRVRWTWA